VWMYVRAEFLSNEETIISLGSITNSSSHTESVFWNSWCAFTRITASALDMLHGAGTKFYLSCLMCAVAFDINAHTHTHVYKKV
jgi:hypothetical protein